MKSLFLKTSKQQALWISQTTPLRRSFCEEIRRKHCEDQLFMEQKPECWENNEGWATRFWKGTRFKRLGFCLEMNRFERLGLLVSFIWKDLKDLVLFIGFIWKGLKDSVLSIGFIWKGLKDSVLSIGFIWKGLKDLVFRAKTGLRFESSKTFSAGTTNYRLTSAFSQSGKLFKQTVGFPTNKKKDKRKKSSLSFLRKSGGVSEVLLGAFLMFFWWFLVVWVAWFVCVCTVFIDCLWLVLFWSFWFQSGDWYRH